MRNCFCSHIPVKGAISKGKFTADFEKSLYYGQPLIDAFQLQETVKYYGCVIDNLVEKEYVSFNNIFQKSFLINYETPFSNGRVKHYNVNWLHWWRNEEPLIFNHICNYYFSVHGETRKYVDNTFEFYEYCKNRNVLL